MTFYPPVPASGQPPWQFRPETYGARGDGRLVADGAMTSGSAVLTCATSAPFVSTDTGKHVLVWGAGGSHLWLFTTILSVTSSSRVTLSATAAAAVTGAGVIFGTDDTAAIQAAVNAAAAYAQAGNGKASEVLFSDAVYCVAAAATTASSGNAQITLPVVDATVGAKIRLTLTGAGSGGEIHWTQPQPVQSGTILLGMRRDGALDNSNGPTSVIGGPVNGYGGSNGTYSNVLLTVDGIGIMYPPEGGTPTPYAGMDLFGIAAADVRDFSYLPVATVIASTSWPYLDGGPLATPAFTVGLRMPATGNLATSDIGTVNTWGAQYGLIGADHLTVFELKTFWCTYGLLIGAGTIPPSGNPHGATIVNWASEHTTYPLGTVSSGYYQPLAAEATIQVDMLTLESYTQVISDSAGVLNGQVNFEDLQGFGTYYGNLYFSSVPPGVRLMHATQSGGAVTPPSIPATTVACGNYFYRDAVVIIASGGAAVSVIKIDSTATGLTLGTSGAVTAVVPSGHSVSLTYAGAAPTWAWILL